MGKVIAVSNQKGGVSKSTTVLNLGIGLAREGKKVLIIDNDPQGSLTASLGYGEPDDISITLASIMTAVINEEEIHPEYGILHHEEGVDLLPGMRRYPPYVGNERFICPEKRNNRTNLWDCQREPWIPLYTNVWKSPNGNESGAYLCLHESEKTGQDEGKMELSRSRKEWKCLCFGLNSDNQKKNGSGACAPEPLCLQSELPEKTREAFYMEKY